MATKRKNFLNLLVKNYWPDLKITWHKLSLDDPLIIIFDLSKNMAAREWSKFLLWMYIGRTFFEIF